MTADKITHYVYSTLTCDNNYTAWEKGGGDVPHSTGSVLIKGGSNVANRKTLVTPLGVATGVSDKQLAMLEANPEFRKHSERGFIKVLAHKADPESVVGDMETRGEDAPLVPQDYKEDDVNTPKPVLNTDNKKSGGKKGK